ncbi:PadR family transcriptional regulator [Nonomuraea sp. NPDC050536]|uniref:PadR family transcriptional regulator n=1 Tax=Nonomuraea sp. NPDC050536 TaxID=3364366 RepID=UPI0037C6D8EE
MSARPLNTTSASLLGLLHEEPMTGWDLVRAAEFVLGDFWALNQSQVYRELSAMAEKGLVQASERGARDRRPYSITDAGRAAFAEWMREPPGRESHRIPWLLKLTFGRHLPPANRFALIHEQRVHHQQRLAHYEQLRAATEELDAPDVYALALIGLGIAYESGVVQWLSELPAEIRGPEDSSPEQGSGPL